MAIKRINWNGYIKRFIVETIHLPPFPPIPFERPQSNALSCHNNYLVRLSSDLSRLLPGLQNKSPVCRAVPTRAVPGTHIALLLHGQVPRPGSTGPPTNGACDSMTARERLVTSSSARVQFYASRRFQKLFYCLTLKTIILMYLTVTIL